jgi:hypothetical protein
MTVNKCKWNTFSFVEEKFYKSVNFAVTNSHKHVFHHNPIAFHILYPENICILVTMSISVFMVMKHVLNFITMTCGLKILDTMHERKHKQEKLFLQLFRHFCTCILLNFTLYLQTLILTTFISSIKKLLPREI